MITKLLRSIQNSKHRTKTGSNYFRERIKNSYRNREKYLELHYKASLKKRVESNPIDEQMPRTKKGIRQEFGNPKFCLKNGKSITTEIIFYQTHLGKFNAYVEFHFYQDTLFFYTYSFNNVSEHYRKEIILLLEEKYLNKNEFDHKKQIITDGQSIINVETGFNFSIHFFAKNHEEIFDVFSARIQQIKQDKFRLTDKGEQLVYHGF